MIRLPGRYWCKRANKWRTRGICRPRCGNAPASDSYGGGNQGAVAGERHTLSTTATRVPICTPCPPSRFPPTEIRPGSAMDMSLRDHKEWSPNMRTERGHARGNNRT
ncbi:predicted protein [Streptomyces filamentosus NRRL 15998]|uniref:Predicted protein n=1 Tax=Streptomyces filamentosus NRRL 15998 TaxID=457431 RepID=D6AIR8_STRFL|nr:predicted protein [Streptomyces filamentosus NRRL 15998]